MIARCPTAKPQPLRRRRRLLIEPRRCCGSGDLTPHPCPADDSAAIALFGRLVQETRTAIGPLSRDTLHVIAFSGGVDSSLAAKIVMTAAAQVDQRTVACIGVSPSLAAAQLQQARGVAAAIGIPLQEVRTHEIADPRYRANDGTACLYCKTELYHTLGAIAGQGQAMAARARQQQQQGSNAEPCSGGGASTSEGLSFQIYNGTNYDDLKDLTRLGLVAAREFQVKSPLQLCAKATVRKIARVAGLPNWDTAASPCLRSRLAPLVPAHERNLKIVELCEEAVRLALGADLAERDALRVRIIETPEITMSSANSGQARDHEGDRYHQYTLRIELSSEAAIRKLKQCSVQDVVRPVFTSILGDENIELDVVVRHYHYGSNAIAPATPQNTR